MIPIENANSMNCIIHDGIKGMKWGVRNGPPYPLDANQHSSLEIKKNPSLRRSIGKSVSSTVYKVKEWRRMQNPKKMTNEELKSRIERLRNEEEFRKVDLGKEKFDGYNGEFAIHSINPKVMDWFYKNRPEYIVGLIVFNELNYKIFKKYTRKIDFISVHKKQLPFKSKKIIIGWTIKNKKEYEKYKVQSDNLICENILDYYK